MELWRTYGHEVEFLIVYIREAHALDSFLPKGGGDDPILEDPTTPAERYAAARQCLTALSLEPMPGLVDTLDDATSRAYAAWPDRLYLIAADGTVAYRGAEGPDGLDPEELEQAIRSELAPLSPGSGPLPPGG